VQFRERLWTYLVVTVVAVLIWFWAAAETRAKGGASFRVALAPSDPTDQVVTPNEFTVRVELEGSRLAMQKARTLEMPLVLTVGNELPSLEGSHSTDVVDLLERNEALRDTGVRVISADLASVDIRVDALVTVSAPVRPVLPSLETEGEIVIKPPQATVTLPSRLRDPGGEELALEAHVDQSRLDRLEPGRSYTLNAELRPPKQLLGQKSVIIRPVSAAITFTVRSRIKETTLPTVRVQIAGPPEDHDEYVIEIDEKDRVLGDVTIKADGALIQQIEQGKATVVALVHLSNVEKERRVESKPVTCFMALAPDGGGTIVEAEINGSNQPPLVRIHIVEREGA
jgi:hypothetical protein